LSENSLSLKILPNRVPPFQIINLGLRSYKLGPSFPSWLRTQSSLSELDISHGLNYVPEWFWYKLEKMVILNISHNNVTGAIPNIPLKLLNRSSIILNSNQFEGKIPLFLLQVAELRLSNNKVSDLFSFICDQNTSATKMVEETNPSLIERRIILPASFSGGTRYMFNNCQDTMTMCKKFGYPDLFITITCNINWSEIRDFVLAKGLSPSDRLDIVCRVFKMKLDEMMTNLKKNDFFGKTTTGMFYRK